MKNKVKIKVGKKGKVWLIAYDTNNDGEFMLDRFLSKYHKKVIVEIRQ